MMLTERDRRIIAAVAEFGILTRAQLATHLAFGSVTRVNAVLLRLVRNEYLTRRLQPTVHGTRRQTYVVGRRGAELLDGSQRPLRTTRAWRELSDLFIEHQLLVNDVRLAFRHDTTVGYALHRWLAEHELRALNLGLIPDAYAEYAFQEKTFAVFLEADNGSETLTRWTQKIAAYRNLTRSGRYAAVFHHQYCRVLVVLPSDRRLQSVRRHVASQTDRLFWFTTFDRLTTSSPLSTIWIRPIGAEPQSLTSPQ